MAAFLLVLEEGPIKNMIEVYYTMCVNSHKKRFEAWRAAVKALRE